MGSDGDRCPDRSCGNEEESHEMLGPTTNGRHTTNHLENENTSVVLTCESEHPGNGTLPSKLRYLPIVTFVFIMLSILISYVIAGSLGHVHWDFPYISHTAIDSPERYIFAQMFNIGAVMLAVNVYVKFLQLEVCLVDSHRHKVINRIAEVIGFISAFGLSMVANFQTRDMQVIHYIGAFSAFICGTAYCWLQTFLSSRITKPTVVTCIQGVVSILLTISLIIFIVSKIVYRIEERRGHGTKYDRLRGVYLVSTSSEWFIAIFMISFVLTFYKDFSNISWKSPRVEIINRTNQVHPDRPHRNGFVI